MIRPDIKQAIDQMCAFHGKTLFETHGLRGLGMSQRLDMEKWDKNHEFKVWVGQAKTDEIWWRAGRDKQTDEEWSEIGSYARKKGIKPRVIDTTLLYREEFDGCINKYEDKAIDIAKDGSGFSITGKYVTGCDINSALKTGLFTEEELKKKYTWYEGGGIIELD